MSIENYMYHMFKNFKKLNIKIEAITCRYNLLIYIILKILVTNVPTENALICYTLEHALLKYPYSLSP